jgi:modulator of FtsH protease HflK
MSAKLKVSLIALGVVTAFAGVKFTLYYISGSMAALAESWHNVSDIGTTLLAVLGILVSDNAFRNSDSRAAQAARRLLYFDPELIVAIIISVMLMSVGGSILYIAIVRESVTIEQPLIAGIVFVILSFGSFFLHRLEKTVAEREGSAALEADSAHHLSDMFISLLTGFSLIINALWFNIDRLMGAFTALVIITISVELFVNVIVTLVRREDSFTHDYKIAKIIGFLFRPQTYSVLFGGLMKLPALNKIGLADSLKIKKLLPRVGRRFLQVTVAALVVGYLSTMFYQVDTGQEALLFRFGKLVNPGETIKPGWHVSLPWPIDSEVRINTGPTGRLEVGMLKDPDSASIWVMEHEVAEEYISGDNSLLNLYATVHYRIEDPYAFDLNTQIDEQGIAGIVKQAITQIFAQNNFYDLVLYKRKEWIEQAEQNIQQVFDQLDTGYKLLNLQVVDLHPPTELAIPFEAVIAAYQERETAVNRAEKSANRKLPEARGQAARIVQIATSESDLKLKKAIGETESYLSRQQAFAGNRRVVQKALQLEQLEQLLAGRPKTIIDPNTGIPAGGMLMLDNYSTDNR